MSCLFNIIPSPPSVLSRLSRASRCTAPFRQNGRGHVEGVRRFAWCISCLSHVKSHFRVSIPAGESSLNCNLNRCNSFQVPGETDCLMSRTWLRSYCPDIDYWCTVLSFDSWLGFCQEAILSVWVKFCYWRMPLLNKYLVYLGNLVEIGFNRNHISTQKFN